MKKIYLLGFASMFALAVNAQTTVKVKNPLKKRTSATEKTIAGPNSVTQVASTIVCNTQYVAGSTMDLSFTFTMSNTDAEYGDYMAITFPAGITPTGVGNTSNPFPNTEDAGGGLEALNAPVGQLISWGVDNNDQYGGIFSSTGITFVVEATIAPGTTGNLIANYDLSGDGYGATPGDQMGATFTIYEAGASVVNLRTTFVQPYNLTSLNTCSYGLDSIVGQIKNLGTTTETNISVACTVNGVAQTPFVVPTLAPGDSAYVGYLPAYDFNAATDYTIVAYVGVASDIDLTNDTASLTFNNALPTDLATTVYSNGF